MLKKPWRIYVWTFIVALSHGAYMAQAEEALRAHTVDDLLKIEGIGVVRFASDERSIILEYLPPYEERGRYGVDRGGRILQLSLVGERQVTPLFEHQPGTRYWLGEASPDGRRLLVFYASREQVQLAVFDFDTESLARVNEIPQVNERFEMNGPVWINDHEFVFSSRARDWSEYGIRQRPYVADKTSALHERAFAGETSVVSISTKPDEYWYDGTLLRYNVDTKQASVLGRGRFGDFLLSADGRRLAALRLGQRLLRFPVDQLTDYFRFDTKLYIFDLENNSSGSYLLEKHVSMGSLRWSNDAPKLSFFAWDRTKTMEGGAHHVLDFETASVTPVRFGNFVPSGVGVARLGARNTPIAAEWLNNELIAHGVLIAKTQRTGPSSLASGNLGNRQEAKWYRMEAETMTAQPVADVGGQPHAVHWLRDGRLLLRSNDGFFVAAEGETPIVLEFDTGEAVRILNGSRGDEIDDTIVFTAQSEGPKEFGFFDFVHDKEAEPTTEIASHVVAWAPDTHQVIVRADSKEGGVLYLQRPTEAPVPIFSFNQHLSDVEHPRWETIEYRGADGVGTFSCVLLPYNYQLGKSYPTIVDIYPGTGKGCRRGPRIESRSLGASDPFYHSNDVLAAAGYLVVRPSNTYVLNYDGSSVFGGLSAQVDAALDALVDKGMTDPERIGIWGFSNGSMASLWLASVSQRYKAVIPMFGASSPHIEYFAGTSTPTFQSYVGRPLLHLVQYESESGLMPHSMGQSAIADPLGYVMSSPLDRARYICSPLMMIHSDLDSFTPYHYEALFSAMYRLSKQAALVRYYGEGHGLTSPGNIRDFYSRVLTFFDRHVATGAPVAQCNHPEDQLGGDRN